jgi:hypothetical protein
MLYECAAAFPVGILKNDWCVIMHWNATFGTTKKKKKKIILKSEVRKKKN